MYSATDLWKGKGRSAALEVYVDVIGPLGFIEID